MEGFEPPAFLCNGFTVRCDSASHHGIWLFIGGRMRTRPPATFYCDTLFSRQVGAPMHLLILPLFLRKPVALIHNRCVCTDQTA